MKKIGLCSVTFRDKSVDEIVDLALENGLNFIEWGGDIHLKPGDFDEARRIKALCDKNEILYLSLIHISEPTRPCGTSRMPSSA